MNKNYTQQQKNITTMRNIPKNSYLAKAITAVAILFSMLFINTTIVAQVYNPINGMIEHTIASGSGEYKIPNGVYEITVEAIGGGGGGGSVSGNGSVHFSVSGHISIYIIIWLFYFHFFLFQTKT